MVNSQGGVRSIKKFGMHTPMFVPSFSSKGFPHVKSLHHYLKEKLTYASLVSSYDLHYEQLDIDNIYESEILFIDSGGYERNYDHDISDIYGTLHFPSEWNEELFEKQVEKIAPITDIVLVNFDYIDKSLPLEEQIYRAKVLFEKYPGYASDFLIKPISSEEILINVDEVINKVSFLESFDILGFTEKELGSSILDRASNIYKIRKALSGVGMDTPIHIFGCLDPLSATLYFLCGADIFDGLSWLRFSFNNGTATYLNQYSINSGLWNRDENEMKLIAYSENLDELSVLKNKLENFHRSSKLEDLGLKDSDLREILLIFEQINQRVGDIMYGRK
ncbi:Uncharacterised protein [Actinobacillus pleuropneumoniae]|nr:Uncharacterised protein [Actinobacillus pleuropneumoniae]